MQKSWLQTRVRLLPPMASISKLLVYPLKGARGIEVQLAEVTGTGLAFDRHFVIVNDSASGRFETQRSEPRMALIETHLPPEVISGEKTDFENVNLEITAPGLQPLKIPLVTKTPGGLRSIKVWHWAGKAIDQGDVAAKYLSEYFAKPVRLVRYAGEVEGGRREDATRRAVDSSWAPGTAEVAFSDGFPMLLTNQASLEDINKQLEEGSEEIPMNRFRPNIVVAGAAAWEEDSWHRFSLGSATFSSVKPCDRCKVTTTDQETAAVATNKEPLKTLAKIRSGSVLGWDAEEPQWKNSVFMGWNLIPDSSGLVKVGDKLEDVQKRTSQATSRS